MSIDDYKFDIFLSYPRRRPHIIATWVTRYFYPQLWEFLALKMGRDPSFFIDVEIDKGSNWPSRIESALLRSRCLVAIWAPTYFRSEWCVAEWQSMLARQKGLLAEESRDYRLIYPIKFSDGEHFWEEAQATAWDDLSEWAYACKGFEDSDAFFTFQKKINKIAEDLKDMIDEAPGWRRDWPVLKPPLLSPPVPLIPGVPRDA